MSKAIYIATIESDSGKSLVSLGLLRMMLTKSSKVGYFRPIINDHGEDKYDNHTNTAINFFNLDIDYNDCYAYKYSEVIQLLSQGKSEEVIHSVIEKFKKLEAKYDYVLVEGSDFSGKGGFTELDVNLMIAKNLGVPALIVGSGNNKTKKEFVNSMQLTYKSFTDKEVDVIGLVANKIEEDEISYIKTKLQKKIPKKVQLDVIPKIDFLANPTVKEVVEVLKGRVLFGKQFLDNTIGSYSTGAMQLRNYLTRIKENALVVTPGDRADLILQSIQMISSEIKNPIPKKDLLDLNLEKAIKLDLLDDKDIYFKTEVEVLKTFCELLKYDVSQELISEYVNTSKKLASLERKLSEKVLEQRGILPEVLVLDILNSFKPFVFNRHTVEEFKKDI